MAKINDVKAYWREQAAKAGLDADTLKQVEPFLDNPAFLKPLTDGFKPIPDYSADLDATRARAVQETEGRFKTWFDGEQQKYQHYTTVIDEHTKYKEKYGALENPGGGGGNGGGGGDGGGGGMTREELEQIFARRDANALDYMDIRERHMLDFKKPLDRKAFETFAKEHPEYQSLGAAYEKFVEPETTKLKDADVQRKMDERYQEGLRDGASRRGLPTSTGSREFSPLMDQKQDVLKLSEREQDQHSRESFLAALNNPDGDGSKK